MAIAFSKRVQDLHGSAIREAFKALSKPGMISFAGGSPAAETFPLKELSEIAADVIAHNGAVALQYGITEGYAPLVEQVKARLAKINTGNERDSVIIVTGGQQGIELTAKAFLNEGDGVACENPSFVGALNAFRSYNAKLYGVDMDEDGMKIDELDRCLRQHPEIKLVYTIPTFQNPTGRTMSLERRKQLLETAKKHDVLVLEDNPYGDLRFKGENVPTIKSLDTENRVIYVGSFSKIISPGLRIGFLCAQADLVEKLVVCKQVSDVHTNLLAQVIVSAYLDRYDIDEHIELCRALYGRKCALMQDCIRRYFPENVTATNPEGGIFLWCNTHSGIDSKQISADALQVNVAIVAGASAMPDPSRMTSEIRLNYSTAPDEQIEAGIKALGGLLHRYKS